MSAGKRDLKSQASASVSRCPHCGRRNLVEGACSACGQRILTSSPPRSGIINQEEPAQLPLTVRPAMLAIPHAERALEPVASGAGETLSLRFRVSEVRGRAIAVNPGPHEPMDFDPWRWVAIPLWGLVLLLSPFVAGIIAWKSAGFLIGLMIAIGCIIVLRFVFSDRLLQSWYFTAALSGRHVVEPMPVVMARLRMEDSREIQLRFKGHLSGGAIMEGDRLWAEGTWRHGVFRVRQSYCERTGATVIPRQPKAFGLAVTGAGVFLAACMWLIFLGFPWVSERMQSIRSSVSNPISQLQNNYQIK